MKYRKNIRLKNYDYSSDGYYFVTICRSNRIPILCSGGHKSAIKECIKNLPKFIKGLSVNYFTVMDNHIHVIFVLDDCKKTLGQIVRAMKYNITKIIIKKFKKQNVAAGLPSRNYERPHGNAAATKKGIWQPNYYEHIIRNEKALYKIRKYIRKIPMLRN